MNMDYDKGLDKERVEVFLKSLDIPSPTWLTDLEKEAKAAGIPIIRWETQELLKVLLTIKMPKSLLEIGTATGFSALLMSEYVPEECSILTIENYEKRIPIALDNFKKAKKDSQIRLLPGDAMEILKTLEGTFDFIFMDAAKAQYIFYLEEVKRLLCSGGILVTDNVLQEGDILESRYNVRRRDRTIHKRMRAFLQKIKQDRDFVTTILPQGDGVSISVKKGVKNE